MAEELSLDEIRLKELDELSDDEGKFLKEHEEDLTDEERESYKEILSEEEGEDESVTFKNQGEFDSAVDKRVKEMQTQAETEEETEKGQGEDKGDRLFPEKYKPKDWDEFSKDFLGIIRKDREIHTKEQRERVLDIDRKLDQDTEDLRKIDSSVPATGTTERREFDRSLAEIMIKDPKISTITKAYGVYKEDQGDDNKNKQTNLAKKVGGGSGTADTTKKLKYARIASRDLDDAEAAAVAKFKKLS